MIFQAQPAERQNIAARAQNVMKMLVAHYNRVMPKASLSFGTLEVLFGQPDNKLFDALQSVCCTSTAEPIFPPGAMLLPMNCSHSQLASNHDHMFRMRHFLSVEMDLICVACLPPTKPKTIIVWFVTLLNHAASWSY